LGALNVYYRDIQVLVPFLMQLWMYASPVVYSANILTSPMGRFIYSLNPMAGVLQGFRWSLLGTDAPGPEMLLSSIITIIFFITGLVIFQRVQRTMADVV
jgi:lipopolysaccharide transport system permease protein